MNRYTECGKRQSPEPKEAENRRACPLHGRFENMAASLSTSPRDGRDSGDGYDSQHHDLHSAKGLEFALCFSRLGRSLFPHKGP